MGFQMDPAGAGCCGPPGPGCGAGRGVVTVCTTKVYNSGSNSLYTMVMHCLKSQGIISNDKANDKDLPEANQAKNASEALYLMDSAGTSRRVQVYKGSGQTLN